MNKLKKVIFSVIFLTFSLLGFALPGFSPFLPDINGEFVYYKDNTFERESYIGILCYDENTFQIRYYAPQTKKLPEKTVAALITIDSAKNYLDITGENVIIADYNSKDDVDIVNYMHNLMYDFSAKRITLQNLTPQTENYVNNKSLNENGLKIKSNLTQFGGEIYIIYDCIIPFFNIKQIQDATGKILFDCVELGKINSSEDTIFDKFLKIPEIRKTKLNSVKQKKYPKKECSLGNQKITLDESWEQKNSMMWVQNNDAIITLATYQKPKNQVPPLYFQYILIRLLLETKPDNIIDFSSAEVTFTENGFKIYAASYMPSASKVFYTIKFLTKNFENDYDFMSFAAPKSTYIQKRSYFDKILKTYQN